jgi:hypothetical protein
MSATGKAKDARASRAKPRLEERVCEHGWRPTFDVRIGTALTECARRAGRRASAHTTDKIRHQPSTQVAEVA